MYRIYNGSLYQKGKMQNQILSKSHVGDNIRVEVDLGLGTIDYRVNGVLQNSPAFSKVVGILFLFILIYTTYLQKLLIL